MGAATDTPPGFPDSYVLVRNVETTHTKSHVADWGFNVVAWRLDLIVLEPVPPDGDGTGQDGTGQQEDGGQAAQNIGG